MVCLSSGLIAIGLAVTAQSPAQPAPGELNQDVLALLRSYARDGTHRYHWPKSGTWAGNTRDLHYAGELLSAGDPQGRAFCCGLTFEVFVRAYQSWCERRAAEFVIPGFDGSASLAGLRRQWFGSDGDVTCSSHAILDNQLGTAVAREAARPGDFVQFWRKTGSGHSVIFIDWVRAGETAEAVLAEVEAGSRQASTGPIAGLCYWSTQRSTKGIGFRVEWFTDAADRGLDPQRVHIARIGTAKPIRRAVTRKMASDARLFIPAGFALDAGDVDLVVHLKGAHRAVRTAFAARARNAVLISVHHNGLSSVFKRRFEDPSQWTRLLARAREELAELFPGADLRWGYTVLSAFSAGYGGVREVLAQPGGRRMVDAVVLGDGLHTGYVDGLVDTRQMAGFLWFAREAVAGRRRFLFSHSAIAPGSYASTTECADYLIAGIEAQRDLVSTRNELGMRLHSRCRRGGLSIYGFKGADGPAHVLHLRLVFELLDELPLRTLQ